MIERKLRALLGLPRCPRLPEYTRFIVWVANRTGHEDMPFNRPAKKARQRFMRRRTGKGK